MFEVKIKDSFDAAHNLVKAGANKSCEKLHGHRYFVVVKFRCYELNEVGMAIDFTIAKDALRKVLNKLDHQYLNELEAFQNKNTTAEHIARYIYHEIKDEIQEIYSVSVWESETACATYAQ
ncbi:MAG: 6-carboxytetrahydropterin synthase [Abditibacteriota bacterium]|nr:6-carboxytetrahydropterin synthase [Abditibacteriota bacterium]